MKIIELKTSEIKPYEKNPRRNDESVDLVAESIRNFGFKSPIIVDKDNVIVCGHTRLKAAEKLNLEKVPCIIADDLTPEQVKAYRLADNKVSEFSEWDYDLLDSEIGEILDIDMTDFGFEFGEDDEISKKRNANTTQKRVESILNLGIEQFQGDGKYDIPIIRPVYDIPEITNWIGFNYVLSDNSDFEKKKHTGVHFFIDDYQFERVWNAPEKYIDILREYGVVCTPDFSPYGDMPLATQIFNHYRKHWVGAYWQKNGITIIPTIRKSTDQRSNDFYLDGEPKNGIVIISNMWIKKQSMLNDFKYEYDVMIKTLNPKKIYVYGSEMQLEGNIEYIPSFSRNRFKTVE